MTKPIQPGVDMTMNHAIQDGVIDKEVDGSRIESVPSSNGQVTQITAPVHRSITEQHVTTENASDDVITDEFVTSCLHRNQVGDAELVARLFRDQLVFDASEDEWYLWNGQHWKYGVEGKVRFAVAIRLGQQYLDTAAQIMRSAQRTEISSNLVTQLQRRSKQVQASHHIKGVLDFAQGLLSLGDNRWDSTPMLLGVANGVLDLRTGELRDGVPSDYIRKIVPVEYKGLDEPSPEFDKFMRTVFLDDPEKESFMLRLFGYALTGTANEHILPILYGSGGNGKDTLVGIIEDVLGPFAAPISTDALIQANGPRSSGGPTTHIMALQGLRMAFASETERSAGINSAQVKLLTGGGTIVGRPLYSNEVRFRPTHTMLLLTNNLPKVPASDEALWRRIYVIEFKQTFKEHPTPGVPFEHAAIPGLRQKMKQEHSGILARLVQGCLEYQNKGLAAPESVRLAGSKYRHEYDVVGHFLSACCWEGPNNDGFDRNGRQLQVQSSALYEAYRTWCESQAIEPMNSTQFGKDMSRRGIHKVTKQYVFYLGISLRPVEE